MTNNPKHYMILYHEPGNEALIDPWSYRVVAEDYVHAEEQFYDAEPDCEILWVVETDDYDVALNNYYEASE